VAVKVAGFRRFYLALWRHLRLIRIARNAARSKSFPSNVIFGGTTFLGTGFLAPITNLISGQCLAVSVASSPFQFARLFSPESAHK
jgi:hypothetical protein